MKQETTNSLPILPFSSKQIILKNIDPSATHLYQDIAKLKLKWEANMDKILLACDILLQSIADIVFNMTLDNIMKLAAVL